MPAVGQPSLEPRFQTTSAPKEVAASPSAPVDSHPIKTALERLALTQRAPQIMRRHLVRTAIRVSVLLAGDTVALLLLRVTLHGVRDIGWFGPATSALINRIIPQGALPLVQLLPAILLGLIVARHLRGQRSPARFRPAGCRGDAGAGPAVLGPPVEPLHATGAPRIHSARRPDRHDAHRRASSHRSGGPEAVAHRAGRRTGSAHRPPRAHPQGARASGARRRARICVRRNLRSRRAGAQIGARGVQPAVPDHQAVPGRHSRAERPAG